MAKVFRFPLLLLGVLGGAMLVHHWSRKRDEQFWANQASPMSAQHYANERELARSRHDSIAAALAALQSTDRGFSWVLFEDFSHAMYTEAHTLRGGNDLKRISPFLSEGALSSLARHAALRVDSVVIGSSETLGVSTDNVARTVRANLRFEANYTEHTEHGPVRYYSHELWTFTRSADLPSRPPTRARMIGCASCGAPLEKLAGGKCQYCGAPSTPGAQDWLVEAVQFVERTPQPPGVIGDTVEVGTDQPTLTAPDVGRQFSALTARDPQFAWSSFIARVNLIFQTFHQAWSAQDLADVRAYLSDNLFATQQYWIGAYRAQQLKNITELPQILNIALSRIMHDAIYDAITVRVFAQCIDYTVSDAGLVVAGHRDQFRQYSEYWTLIRGTTRRGAIGTAPACPNCGASLDKINMAGSCGSCGVRVTSADFDWVLSRIEQDEVYRL